MTTPTIKDISLARIKSGSIGHLNDLSIRALLISIEKRKKSPKTKFRDKLLIMFLIDSCMRISEALSITYDHILNYEQETGIRVLGKGAKFRIVSLSQNLLSDIHKYCSAKGLKPKDRIFAFTRDNAFKIMKETFREANIQKPEGVGYVHIFRHTGLLLRLEKSRHPQAIMNQAGHSSYNMMFKYLRTLDSREGLSIMNQVNIDWDSYTQEQSTAIVVD